MWIKRQVKKEDRKKGSSKTEVWQDGLLFIYLDYYKDAYVVSMKVMMDKNYRYVKAFRTKEAAMNQIRKMKLTK